MMCKDTNKKVKCKGKRFISFILNLICLFCCDVEASLIEATAIMSRLLSNESFLAQLARAREEYARKMHP